MTINKYKPAKNKFSSIATHDPLVNFSFSLNILTVSIQKIMLIK